MPSSEPVAFSAAPQVWRLITDHWYGGRSTPFDMEVHKAAEKLMGDVDEAASLALDETEQSNG